MEREEARTAAKLRLHKAISEHVGGGGGLGGLAVHIHHLFPFFSIFFLKSAQKWSGGVGGGGVCVFITRQIAVIAARP